MRDFTREDDREHAAWLAARQLARQTPTAPGHPLRTPEDVAKDRARDAYRSLMAKVHYNEEVKCPPTP